MRRPTATTVSADEDEGAAQLVVELDRFQRRIGLGPREPVGAGARQLAPLRRLVDVGRPERVRLDAGLVEQRQASRRTGGKNEFGAAEHQVIWGMKQGVNCARNLSEGG